MVHRYHGGQIPAASARPFVDPQVVEAEIDAALDDFDFRRAVAALWTVVDQANRAIDRYRPWELAAAERAGDANARQQLDHHLATLLVACRALARHLAPFLPSVAKRIASQCGVGAERLPTPYPLFPRLRERQHKPAAIQ
jgi:methionyl-tRNA synthetase